MKTLYGDDERRLMMNLLWEIRFQKTLAGAGGTPLFHGLFLNPPTMLMSYTGRSYMDWVETCEDWQIVESLIEIAKKVDEIHSKNIIHNDLKIDNITVTKNPNLQFHVIDLGLGSYNGEVLGVKDNLDLPKWMAPEYARDEPTTPNNDIFSFGYLMDCLIKHYLKDEQLKQSIRPLAECAMEIDPQDRPTLTMLIEELQSIAETQSHQKNFCKNKC